MWHTNGWPQRLSDKWLRCTGSEPWGQTRPVVSVQPSCMNILEMNCGLMRTVVEDTHLHVLSNNKKKTITIFTQIICATKSNCHVKWMISANHLLCLIDLKRSYSYSLQKMCNNSRFKYSIFSTYYAKSKLRHKLLFCHSKSVPCRDKQKAKTGGLAQSIG